MFIGCLGAGRLQERGQVGRGLLLTPLLGREEALQVFPESFFPRELWGSCVPGPLYWDIFLQGKVFPKLRKRSPQGSAESTSSDKEEDEATDYVFRIIYPGMQPEMGKWPRLLAPIS